MFRDSKVNKDTKIKKCKKCGEEFVLSRCKPCYAIYKAEYYLKNIDRITAAGLSRRIKEKQENPEKKPEYDRLYRENNKQKISEWQRKYRLLNSERLSLYLKNWTENNKELKVHLDREYRKLNKPKRAVYAKKYNIENKDKLIAYREKNSERNIELRRLYYEKNREKILASFKENRVARRVYAHNRRARIIGNGGKLSKGLTDKLLILQRGRCACCKKSVKNGHHLDHVMPLKLGGANDDSNMQILCPTCNRQKSAKHPVAFMQSRGYLF